MIQKNHLFSQWLTMLVLLAYFCVSNIGLHAFSMDLVDVPVQPDTHEGTDCHRQKKTTSSVDCFENCLGGYDELSSTTIHIKQSIWTIAPIVSVGANCSQVVYPSKNAVITPIVDPPPPVLEMPIDDFHKSIQPIE